MPSPTLPSAFSGKTVAAVYASDEEDGAPFSPYSGDVTADGKVDWTATHSGGERTWLDTRLRAYYEHINNFRQQKDIRR